MPVFAKNWGEIIHQPYFDTLTRGLGIGTVPAKRRLFGAQNQGTPELTNMDAAGVFSSDNYYLIKALRAVMWFQGLADDEFTRDFGSLTAMANVTGTNARAQDLYAILAYGLQMTLSVGKGPMFTSWLYYAPAGGGPHGQSTENSRHVITNGLPSQEAICKLGRAIAVEPRQGIKLEVESFPFARLGNGQGGGDIGRDLSPIDHLNQFDGAKLVSLFLDGYLTRRIS